MPKVQWQSEAAGKVVADWEKITGKTRQGTDATKQFTKAQEDLTRISKRVLREVETGQERVNRKIAEANQLHKAGKLTQEQLERVTSRLRTTNERTFGRDAVVRLANFAAGFVGIAAGVRLVSQALQTAEGDAQRAADSIFNSLQQFGELQQLGGGAAFTKNKEFAYRLLRGGVVSESELGTAADIGFALTSAGYSDAEKETLTRAAEAHFVRTSKLVEFGGALRKYGRTFGQDETGGLQAILRKAVVASEVAQSDIPTILTAATQFGGEAKAIGLSDEEALAAFLAVEQRSPNAEIAGTRMRSFLNQVSKRNLRKGTFQQTLAGIQGRIDAGESAFDVLGESRAVSGFRNIMEGRDAVRELTARLQVAQGDASVIADRIAALREDPEFGPAVARRRAEGELAYGRIKRTSAKENLFDTIRAEQINKLEGGNFIDRMMAYPVRGLYAMQDVLGMEGTTIREAAAGKVPGQSQQTQQMAQDFLSGSDNGASERSEEYLERTAAAVETSARLLEDIARRPPNLGPQE